MKNLGLHWIGFFLRNLNKVHLILIPFCLGFSQLALGKPYEVNSSQLSIADDLTWKEKMRINALKNLDDFLNWSLGEKSKAYVIANTLEKEKVESHFSEMQEFNEKYGYFSHNHPIVARVSSNPEDLEIIRSLFQTIYEKVKDPVYLQIAVAEVMTKVLAYYDLKIGQSIRIPIEVKGKIVLERFVIDRIFNLWYGMPAFGLMPEKKGINAILLYRGTDFSLDSKRGWASLVSDLDMAGPGLTAFQKSQKEISEWLKAAFDQKNAARIMGFSLGGALAAYTFIYENPWLAERGSISFGAPGVKEKVIADWHKLPEERRTGFTSYVNMGDVVPKVGKLFGNVYVLSGSKDLKPLAAHTLLISSEAHFIKAKVDVNQDNEDRFL